LLIFVSGGVRSGKSSYGEKLVQNLACGRKIYLATSEPCDDEMKNRIMHHKEQRRDKCFITLEKSRSIGEIAKDLNDSDTVLLDCLGNLLANEMFDGGAIDDIFKDICSINEASANLIVISNDVFSDGCRYSESVVRYVDKLAELHKLIVAEADIAVESIYGNYIFHKGLL
jgi:adenosylcobinamide kinase/adenosylcobinamide-phosphate guanylyltransferase